MLRLSALEVAPRASAGGGRAVSASVRPVAKQPGTHHLIRLSGSRSMAACLQGFLEGQQDGTMIMT